MTLKRRIALLALLAALGTAAGAAGAYLTGNDAWYLAIPGAIGLGWLFVARPTECVPVSDPEGSRPRDRRG